MDRIEIGKSKIILFISAVSPIIDGGNDNKINSSAAFDNCRDGIEIDNEGNDNSNLDKLLAFLVFHENRQIPH